MILSLLLALPAQAIDLKFWGVGPTLGTMAIPTGYPVAIPANAEDADGNPLVAKVKGDVEVGVRAVAYPSASGRIAGRAILGFGTQKWNRQELVVGYDQAIVKEGDFQLLLGGGIGAGTEKFHSTAADEGFLRTNYFPLRVELDALLRDRTRAYEFGLYGTFHIVGDQSWYDQPGDTDPTSGSEAANTIFGAAGVAGGSYLSIGAEARVYFGDFKSRQKSGGKKKTKK